MTSSFQVRPVSPLLSDVSAGAFAERSADSWLEWSDCDWTFYTSANTWLVLNLFAISYLKEILSVDSGEKIIWFYSRINFIFFHVLLSKF